MVDALASGASGSNPMEVRILFRPFCVEFRKLFRYNHVKPGWRNWYTRSLEVAVGAIPCRFNSCPGHYGRLAQWLEHLVYSPR